MYPAFLNKNYYLKKQAIALTGKIRIYDPQGTQLAYCEQKMFKWREDIRIYADEGKTYELLYIQARNVLDFSGTYDVYDSLTRTWIGALQRKGWKSLTRDEWDVIGQNQYKVATIIEDSLGRALLRRLILGSLMPQNYDALGSNGERLADLKQRFNLVRYEMDIDFNYDQYQVLDPRLGLAVAVLLAIIEGKQES